MNKRFVGVLTFAFRGSSGRQPGALPSVAQPAGQCEAPHRRWRKIALATKDLEVGSVVKEDDVKLAEWPGAIPWAQQPRSKTSSAGA